MIRNDRVYIMMNWWTFKSNAWKDEQK